MNPFCIKDCTLAVIATGIKAQSLHEFHDKLIVVPLSCIFLHFWGSRLTTTFEHREYHNDFSSWARNSLHDDVLAERLELLDPTEFDNLERLRLELLDLVETRLDEREFNPWTKSDEQFHFIGSKILIFDTRYELNSPEDLPQIIPLLTHSSLFYHFIDSARRTSSQGDDFSNWLSGFGNQYKELVEEFKKIDPYFISLSALQRKLTHLVTEFFRKRER